MAEDNRSAVWGGGTMGLLVGLIGGFFTDNYWQTVLYAAGIGVALGVGANLLAWMGSRRK